MIFDSQAALKQRIEQLTPRRVYGRVPVFEDTSSYMSIHGGSVLRLGGDDYFVMGDTKEGRFGIDDQPKFWVKYAVDLTTGQQKIIKLVFHEQFTTEVGPVTVRCRRNPHKESAFLDLVRGHPRFMQGVSVQDPAGNPVRIIDFIRGKNLFGHVRSLEMNHEVYFHKVLPGIMRELRECIEAMAWVHSQGLHHGDIRNDHLLVDSASGKLVWIDFDYEVNFLDYDIWSMGNVLIYAAGKGINAFHDVVRRPELYPGICSSLDEHDASVFYSYRVANLRKLFPHIPRRLNDMLMRFSKGAIDFYEDLQSQADDLRSLYPG